MRLTEISEEINRQVYLLLYAPTIRERRLAKERIQILQLERESLRLRR